MRLLADMEAFVEVAKLRHFGRAAIVLGVTASTLSRRISGLERELGVVLIRRSTRSFVLTESGQQFFERSQSLIEHAKSTRDQLSANFSEISGHVRVGAASDLATTILAPVFSKFCRDNPQISIDLVATQAQPDLSRDSLDVAFAVAHQAKLPDSSYPLQRVGSFPRMMYASRKYLKQRGNPTTPSQLSGYACIRHLNGSAETSWELHCGNRRQEITIAGVWACNSVLACAQAAREHLGVAMLPQHMATHPAFGGGLIRVLPEWEGTPVSIFAVTPDRALPARIRELICVAKGEFGKRLAELEATV